MGLGFVCRCGFATPDLGQLLDHQATGHGDYRFVGAGCPRQAEESPQELAQVARAERVLGEVRAREMAQAIRATPKAVEPWERDEATTRPPARAVPRPAPTSVAAVEASVAYHAAQIELVHRLARRRALERQQARQAGE